MNSQSRYILNFHGLGAPKRPLSAGEQNCWVGTELFACILDIVRGRNDIQITFDDSNDSDYTVALPLLKAHGLTAHFFVVAARVDGKGFLSKEQIKELCRERMVVGSHGMYHRRWVGLQTPELHEELVQAKESIEQITEVPVAEAACPFGAYDRKVLRGLRKCGYQQMYTSDGGPASAQSWIKARNTICGPQDWAAFLAMTQESPHGGKGLWRGLKGLVKRWR